ncbi:MAG: hypothetical protein EAX91_04405 [Candidatus Lokiarchaeota archaeon]|nr:hypothetical protein [Candidatus Lokiarchaeota archaeon]
MERKAVLKWLKFFSIIFVLLSVVELLDLILFSTIINLNLDGTSYTVANVIFQSGFMAVHATLLWVFLLFVICAYIAISFSIFTIAKKDSIENHTLAKFLLLIGLFLIIGGFIKTNFMTLLGNSHINTGITTTTLQNALYNPAITPLFGAIMWIYFTVVVSFFLFSGLVFGGVGLRWMLIIQEEKKHNQI